MTHDEIEASKRRMLVNVPFPDEGPETTQVIIPVSFSIRQIGPAGLVFRFVDEQGECSDLKLNAVLAQALHDSIALARGVDLT